MSMATRGMTILATFAGARPLKMLAIMSFMALRRMVLGMAWRD
jgi:hypothetical protein